MVLSGKSTEEKTKKIMMLLMLIPKIGRLQFNYRLPAKQKQIKQSNIFPISKHLKEQKNDPL